MRLNPVIVRLREQCPGLKRVGHADSMEAIDGLAEVPAAFVHPFADQAGGNTLDNDVAQRVGAMFVVQIVARTSSDSAEPLEDARDAIRSALLGWQGEYHEPIEYVRGEVIDVSKQIIWWRDIYVVGTYIRSL